MKRATVDIERDPFGESPKSARRWRTTVLGTRFVFTSNRRELLDLARQAFAQLPVHRWPRAATATSNIVLRYVAGPDDAASMPPKPRMSAGAGLVCAHFDAGNFVIIDTSGTRALIQVNSAMLRHPRLLRYEMIEFAAITAATRLRGLVSLHAGCVGANGHGVLLMGASGAGKSTLALQAALAGLDFLAEDSVFVQPHSLRASGLSAFAHARDEALPLIGDRAARRVVGRAPRIERRSGVRKREIDMRQGFARLARQPLRIVGAVVLAPGGRRDARALAPLSAAQFRRVLRAEQVFARGRPGWREFEQRMIAAGGYRLARVSPEAGVQALRGLLEEARA